MMKHLCRLGDWECREIVHVNGTSFNSLEYNNGDRFLRVVVKFCPFCGFTLDGISDQAEPEPTGARLMNEAQPTIKEVIFDRLDNFEIRLCALENVLKKLCKSIMCAKE